MQKFFATAMLAIMLTLGVAGVLAVPAHAATLDLGVTYAGNIGLGSTDIRTTLSSIIKTAMGLLGIVAVVIILIGGFTWMTAGGNDDKVGEAKKWMFAGVIGLAIILSAYALSTFVINSLINATTNITP